MNDPTMIERMARAAYEAVQRDGDRQWEWDDPAYARVRQTYVTAARAQLLAMREPTEAMILANSDAGGPDDEHTKADWRAMIDAALAE